MLKISEQQLKELWKNFKKNSMIIIRIQEGEAGNSNEEVIIKDIISKKFTEM